jgi:hypothetical protein
VTSTSVECAQVLTVRSVPSCAASPTSPPSLVITVPTHCRLSPTCPTISHRRKLVSNPSPMFRTNKPRPTSSTSPQQQPQCVAFSLSNPLIRQTIPLILGSSQAEIIIGEDSSFYERGVDGERGKKLKKAEITLNDCLACS